MSEPEIKPPKSIWTQRLRMSPGGLFKGLAKLGVGVATQRPAVAATGALDIVGAIEPDADAGEQAGLLISRALASALLKLIDPYKMGFDSSVATDEAGVTAGIDEELRATPLGIPEDFLERPCELAVLAVVKGKLIEWLRPLSERALRGRDPESIAARLPEYFVYELHREALARPRDYERLFAESKFDEEYRRERSWARYRAAFAQQLQGPMFGESFSLPQVYVPLRAYYLAESPTPRRSRGVPEVERADQDVARVVAWLDETLDAWVDGKDPRDAVRVISGDPGAGKSSFARIFVHRWVERGERVLYVPLHRLDLRLSLEKSIAKLCEELDDYPRVDLDGDAAEKRLLLVLDGLDELAKSGKLEARLVEEFVQEVRDKVSNRNRTSLRLRVLLCGRPISVQGVQSQFREPGQVLHLLPYCLTDAERRGHQWEVAGKLLERDQREDWWARFGECTRKCALHMPEELCDEALLELTRQPLLSYLLARYHETALDTGTSSQDPGRRNAIYRALIAQVHARRWGDEAGHPASERMREQQFFELFEDVALVGWHHGERVVSIEALEKARGQEAAEILTEYGRHCNELGQLFAAFFIQQYGAGDLRGAFEFTHKSFAEYLVARRMVGQLEQAVADIEARERVYGSRRERTNQKSLAKIALEWLEVFGPTAISWDLLPYLRDEVVLRDAEEPGSARRWQLGLIVLIEHVLQEGMPCEEIRPRLRFIDARRWARNAEEAFLAMLCACANVTRETSEVRWLQPTSFGEWIRALRGQPVHVGEYRAVVGECLARISAQGQTLASTDLVGANLAHSNLSHANLSHANLANANLAYANLTHASLDSADLYEVNLCFAVLNHANLDYALLDAADLESASLVGASLLHADLGSLDRQSADLESADLQSANLRHARISPAQLAQTRGRPAVLPDGSSPPDDDP